MPSEPRRVTDDAGVEFALDTEIARGNQGAVYRVAGYPEYAIKLLDRPKDLDRIAEVRRLPLDGLPVAAPLTLIRNGGSGYLMHLASDMTPIREPYLPRVFGPRETKPAWYASTGGLKRRLAIAANVAGTIAALHERGLAYVDLNPNNVMVSNDLARTETWLIDTDNLTSRANPRWDIRGFPGYMAPERERRPDSPPSTLADAYTLAIHVFRMLVMAHPLEGVAADEYDGDTAQQLMDRGELPYVAGPEDRSNHLAPRSFPAGLFPLVLSGRMRKLAERTFSAGRLDPTKRPGSARWREVLFSALDNVIDCPDGCGWTYYRLQAKCPKCGTPTEATTLITVYPAVEEQALAARDSFAANENLGTAVLPRHLWGRYDQPDPVLTLRPVRGGFEVNAHDEARVVDGSGKSITKIPKPNGDAVYRLRLDVPDRPSRFLAIRAVQPA
ncbi:lipopolysaccharide kinase InaA family protein [Mycolicibacterium sp. HK-90]|uniref:protein kinase domain-containing protein n=1 Tax=Mycolicibacterium sp. HK-90 TaxID=3056937 RepID=UPI00265B30B2|nr:lipopolysaccharide kinase InaA family protein [Mycolicibacterium sp. HK-90]WKG04641.1 lipopolysaccharide kinase InaA family protein [Mycolicibacterium sp. HK-90]